MTQIARFRHAGTDRLGAVHGEHYIDVTRAYAAAQAAKGASNGDALAAAVLPPDALSFFEGGEASLAALREALVHARSLETAQAVNDGVLVPRSATKTLVPIPNPPKIVCVARNFGKHAAEAGLQISEIPILFPRFAATQVADGDPIIAPFVSHELDWEGELAVVVGKGGRHIAKEDAFDHVGGYTIFNDVTVRDYQFRVTQYTGGKNFHASGPVGPHISLVDEGLDPHNLRITTTVNGVVKQDASTEEFIFDIPTIIEHVSEFIELEPGDIIPMGTPAGVGFKRTPPEYLADGDVIDVTVEGIGTLSNPVRAEAR
ncbi:fumarylacetoacetate hydrolase family protein [Georgenia ruanii]|uniref:Fumarylacetoacetate hydrolase n=1 Tax=Georgenia ruanii TaxID=348442 RepID=A0A7J9UZP2_9MICO|nr:fumarylacetoacetate hydrolase family protein [Georgenia ruanii]MPV89350.1 fumarylacetoacetate hydrolase [Georgenia ruanii]